MRSLALVISFVCLIVFSAQAQSQDVGSMAKDARESAWEGLTVLKQLATEKEYRSLGFQSMEEVRAATLGQPFADTFFPLDRIKEYRKGSDPSGLLLGSRQMIFPVLASGNARSSVTVQKIEDKWRPVAYGSPAYAMLLEKFRQRTDKETPVGMIVRVPALNLTFIGFQRDGRLMLKSLVDEPRYGLRSGEEVSAEAMLESIQPDAKRHDGLPS